MDTGQVRASMLKILQPKFCIFRITYRFHCWCNYIVSVLLLSFRD